MPVVSEVELIPAQIQRLCEKWLNSLQLCSDTEELSVWELESDLTLIRDNEYWTEYMNDQIEIQKQNIKQKEENRLCP